MSRAISVKQLLKMKFKELPFKGVWYKSIGIPEQNGIWIIYGQSGNGKTSFCLKLAKYISQLTSVAYDTLEEGARRSMQVAMTREKMEEAGKFMILDREPISELRMRLDKRKSPKVIFIDSFQYTGMNYRDACALKEDYPQKLFIYVSHAEGKLPQGRSAKKVEYDADVKIRVEGYKAFFKSRYGGGEEFIIWPEGANKYWND